MNAFWTLVCAELFLGGGGRWTAIGPLTLRFVLFGACLLVWAVLFARDRGIDRSAQRVAFAFLGTYLVLTAIGASQGAANGVPVADILGEVRQSLYWFAVPFIAVMMSRPGVPERTARLLLYAGPALALGYFFMIVLLRAGVIDFFAFYYWSFPFEELIFRSEWSFFYKGFLYLGISLVFHLALRGKYWQPIVGLLFVAIVLTLTRGFILSTSVAVLLLIALQRRTLTIVFVSAAALASLVVMFYVFPQFDENLRLGRLTSSGQRVDDLLFIAEQSSFWTFLFGEGYGAMINFRPNIENTFLWAFWRQGVPGLAFWLAPMVLASLHYWRIPRRSPSYALASAYYFGLVCVYVQTATNPFLNNPIGLSYALVALFSIRAIALRHRPVRGAGRSRLPGPSTRAGQPDGRGDAVPTRARRPEAVHRDHVDIVLPPGARHR